MVKKKIRRKVITRWASRDKDSGTIDMWKQKPEINRAGTFMGEPNLPVNQYWESEFHRIFGLTVFYGKCRRFKLILEY
jgi:hypothetical protein